MGSFPSFYAPLPKLALGAAVALAALSLSPGSAQAYVVMVGQLQYDVTTFTGSYNSQPSKFNDLPSGVMPWWNSDTAANAFINASGTSEADLYANLGVNSTTNVIFYAYATPGPPYPQKVYAKDWGGRYPGFYSGVKYGDASYYDGRTISWARATLYVSPAASSVPGPLPLFGAGAAFGFSRKLRKRIQEARVSAGSGQPLA